MKRANCLYATKHYVLLLLLLLVTNSFAQYNNINFKNLSSKDGLSQNTIYKIFQDSRGFFWFGTEDGLNKYDGYKFKLFNDSHNIDTNIFDKEIRFIDEDSNGEIWFGANKVLNKFNRNTNSIQEYHLNAKTNALEGDYINVFLIDNQDRIWVGTNKGVFLSEGNGFKEVKAKSKSLPNLKLITQDKNGTIWLVYDDGIYQYLNNDLELTFSINLDANIGFSFGAILEGNDRLWLGSNLGVYVFNIKEKELTKVVSKKNEEFNTVPISAFCKDKKGSTWVGTMGSGLFKIDYQSKHDYTITQYAKRSIDAPRLSSNHIHDIYIDKSNVLWVGTVLGGVNKGTLDVNFDHFKTDFKELNIVEPDPVFSLCEDQYNNLWIGTYGNGLYKLDKETRTYAYYPGTKKDKSGFTGRQVYNITEDLKGNMWFSTSNGGILKYKRETNTFDVFEHENLKQEKLINSVVFKESNGNIWIGTWTQGVYFYNTSTKELKHFKDTLAKPTDIVTGWVNYIFEDLDKNHLWISYENGLHVIDLRSDIVYKLDNTVNANNGLKSNYIYSIYKDSDSSFWLGTESGLVQVLDYQLKNNHKLELKTRTYTKKDGLLNEVAYGMLEDDYNNLWVSTNNGLVKFNRQTKEIKTYLDSDGLQANEFNMGAFYKNKSGEFLFGGINGITAFYPNKIQNNKVEPKVAITEFRVLNEVVVPSVDGRINKDINEVEELEINFKDNVFSFELAALEYTNPENNQYAYKLEGFEDKWNYIKTRRDITFTNLDPGKYQLKVKASNNDGVWSKEKVIKIQIPPPFWKTIWFYLLMALIALTLIFFLVKIRINQVNLKAEKHLLYLKNEKNNAMLKEIHHRVKNNLQVVNSLLSLQSREVKDERVVSMFKDARKRVLSMAMLHERMYGSADLEHVDIHDHFETLVENLIKSYAVDKDIKLEISIKDVQMGISTLTPLGLLLIEIVSNSLKHAFADRKEGTIYVSLKLNDCNKYELVIGDDGKGYDKEIETSTLGTKLIYIFTKQLNGEIEQLNKPGVVYRLIFDKID
ncbi:ligand-binding sensor domain-containing protein [Pseudofulvibacter geojedonensis]|uniref:Two-component regulator propeller domain-containing protein n=1 Tax=Pseudofulvibacter geojedonensis TaxID=1123758 RepID=A0ABW3I0J3_9FLAO